MNKFYQILSLHPAWYYMEEKKNLWIKWLEDFVGYHIDQLRKIVNDWCDSSDEFFFVCLIAIVVQLSVVVMQLRNGSILIDRRRKWKCAFNNAIKNQIKKLTDSRAWIIDCVECLLWAIYFAHLHTRWLRKLNKYWSSSYKNAQMIFMAGN